jgi:hypothetical protein
MVDKEPLGPKILGYFLWAISALIGIGALFAAIGLVDTVVPRLFVNCDPMQKVACSGQSRTLMMFGYFALGIIWLVWSMILVERYTHSQTPEVVAKRFAITTGIQLAIVAVWLIVTKVLLG